MQVMPVGEFKSQFSKVLQKVRAGKHVGISFGKDKYPIAVLVPAEDIQAKNKRTLGLLEGKATFKLVDDFKMSDEELLES